jgi:hypothetical protein
MGDENLDPAQYSKNVYRAIIANNKDLLLNELLLRERIPAGFQINEYSNYGMTLLHYAAGHSDAEVVERLIQLGANVNSRMVLAGDDALRRFQSQNSYPILIAINRRDQEMVDLLIRMRCNLDDARGFDGLTPLLRATVNRDLVLLNVIARNLHSRGRDPLQQIDTRSFNALDILCQNALSYLNSGRPVPVGILECAVYLMITYTPTYYNVGIRRYGDFNAPEIRRLVDLRAAALQRVTEAETKRAQHFAAHGYLRYYDDMVAKTKSEVPVEPNVTRRHPRIEDFGMNVADFETLVRRVKDKIGFAEDAVARRKQAVLAYASRAGGPRRNQKTQRRRARRARRVRRTLERRRV